LVILGINPAYDAAAAVLVDGDIKAIIEEERLSRIKLHVGFPRRAIKEALRISGVEPREVTCVTFSFVDYLYANTILTRFLLAENGVPIDPAGPVPLFKALKEVFRAVRLEDLFSFSLKLSTKTNYKTNYNRYLVELNDLGIKVDAIQPVDHHLSHAASTYYSSGFDECLIVTADGGGDGLSSTVSVGKRGAISRMFASSEDVSPGQFYAGITYYLGFKVHRHEGKITGLAAHGDPEKCYQQLVPCLGLTEDNTKFTCDIFDPSLTQKFLHLWRLTGNNYFLHSVMNDYHAYYKKHLSSYSREDVAAAAQKRLEDVMVQYIKSMIEITGMKKIALAGGVFGNVKLNQKIFELEEVDEIFIHPNMADGGNALGGAYVAHVKNMDEMDASKFCGRKILNVYLGHEYTDNQIEEEIRKRNLGFRYCEDIESEVAEKLAVGQVVGRFNGKLEYGPRALGNRSILANPSNPDIVDILNNRLKRTEFMPFAPSVLYEDREQFFHISNGNSHAVEFMTITCSVCADKQELIPAVCHVDDTARPHVVKKSVNPSFYKIILEFKKRSGFGVIINTSFNVHEEPIVCSPGDACKAFQENAVDALAIGNFMVE
jgi:carbamoyltransferase